MKNYRRQAYLANEEEAPACQAVPVHVALKASFVLGFYYFFKPARVKKILLHTVSI